MSDSLHGQETTAALALAGVVLLGAGLLLCRRKNDA